MKHAQWHESNLVTLAEAARRLDLRNLSDYKRKYQDFPKASRVEHPQLWTWGSIETWYETSINRRGSQS